MRLIHLGIDVVETARIRASIEKFGDRFLRRVFGEGELAYAMSMPRPELHLAARFAAKEAVSKAFGTGIGEQLGWQDVQIARAAGGQPYVVLSEKGKALAARLGGDHVLVSLTHTEHYAAAQAALVRREEGEVA